MKHTRVVHYIRTEYSDTGIYPVQVWVCISVTRYSIPKNCFDIKYLMLSNILVNFLNYRPLLLHSLWNTTTHHKSSLCACKPLKQWSFAINKAGPRSCLYTQYTVFPPGGHQSFLISWGLGSKMAGTCCEASITHALLGPRSTPMDSLAWVIQAAHSGNGIKVGSFWLNCYQNEAFLRC